MSDRECEQVRLHAYTDCVLAHPESLRRIGVLASQHHERMDGSGYHRGTMGQALAPVVRTLAAADCYRAMTEPRLSRPSSSPCHPRRSSTKHPPYGSGSRQSAPPTVAAPQSLRGQYTSGTSLGAMFGPTQFSWRADCDEWPLDAGGKEFNESRRERC